MLLKIDIFPRNLIPFPRPIVLFLHFIPAWSVRIWLYKASILGRVLSHAMTACYQDDPEVSAFIHFKNLISFKTLQGTTEEPDIFPTTLDICVALYQNHTNPPPIIFGVCLRTPTPTNSCQCVVGRARKAASPLPKLFGRDWNDCQVVIVAGELNYKHLIYIYIYYIIIYNYICSIGLG